jgi:hypothetical protein
VVATGQSDQAASEQVLREIRDCRAGLPVCELRPFGIRQWLGYVLKMLVLECPMICATKTGDTPA